MAQGDYSENYVKQGYGLPLRAEGSPASIAGQPAAGRWPGSAKRNTVTNAAEAGSSYFLLACKGASKRLWL